jgi:hypothetical protein
LHVFAVDVIRDARVEAERDETSLKLTDVRTGGAEFQKLRVVLAWTILHRTAETRFTKIERTKPIWH